MVMGLLDDDDLLDLGPRAKTTDPLAVVREERARKATQIKGANKELEQWLASQGAGGEDGQHPCGICSRVETRLKCSACGRFACKPHSWTMLGLCTDCATAERIHTPDDDRVVGRNWLEG